jgi:hypothetical protein
MGSEILHSSNLGRGLFIAEILPELGSSAGMSGSKVQLESLELLDADEMNESPIMSGRL